MARIFKLPKLTGMSADVFRKFLLFMVEVLGKLVF